MNGFWLISILIIYILFLMEIVFKSWVKHLGAQRVKPPLVCNNSQTKRGNRTRLFTVIHPPQCKSVLDLPVSSELQTKDASRKRRKKKFGTEIDSKYGMWWHKIYNRWKLLTSRMDKLVFSTLAFLVLRSKNHLKYTLSFHQVQAEIDFRPTQHPLRTNF